MGKFSEVAAEIGALVTEKNLAYGDSFAKCGDFLRLLWPNGIAPDQYGDALAMVRIFDKQMRIATAKDALGESPYRDIAGYGILGAVKDESQDAKETARAAFSREGEESAVKKGSATCYHFVKERNFCAKRGLNHVCHYCPDYTVSKIQKVMDAEAVCDDCAHPCGQKDPFRTVCVWPKGQP